MVDRPRPPLSASSGDLLLDRRLAFAAALADRGDAAAAADLLEEVVTRAPTWLPAWMALGAAQEQQGAHTAAERAYAAAAALDDDGHHGATLHLARLRGRTADPTVPAAYVSALFDGYASRFNRHLVDGLGYRGPAVILEALHGAGAPTRFGAVLDLGCGTGLMGRAIRPRADHLAGVDLSAAMVAEAARTGLYDQLTVATVAESLAAAPEGRLDLVLAADVFVYCGRLEGVIAATARALASGGLLAFTVQKGDGDVVLGPDLRVAHSAAYLRATVAAAGLALPQLAEVSTRTEKQSPVPGLVAVARKP